ncbi:MAG: hypothetical protein H7A21_17935 [Spirochaetales bacterium]|nr:hypothetical protein [Spirochaetales bacterium]MCP5484110.1 hypothetical protein [Spirochaetales bacterium]
MGAETDVSVYHGSFSKTNLGDILLAGETHYYDSYITVAALNRDIPYRVGGLEFEAEGQIVRHSGLQKHLEYNGLLMGRLGDPWSGWPFSIAVGEGLSFATRNPDLENPRRGLDDPGRESEWSRNLLNYMVFELEMALPLDSYRPRAFFRIHHRSGIYGIFCPPTCGSNYLAYGIKFEL